MRSLVLAAALCAAGGANAAETGLKGSAGVSFFDFEDASLTAVTGRLGFDANRYLGFEGEVSLGVDDDQVNGVTVELDRALGLFAVGKIPVDGALELFGRIGYTDVEVEASAGPFRGEGEADGLGFGVGATYDLSPRFGLRADYSQYDGDDEDIDVWGVAGTLKF